MSSDSAFQLLYLGILLLAIGGSVLTLYRGQFRRMVVQFLIWVAICAALVIGYDNKHLFEGILYEGPQSTDNAGNVTLLRNESGYFEVRALVNETPVTFIVDTGASLIVLSRADATRVGFDLDGLNFTGIASTANGEVRFANVLLDSFTIGKAVDTRVPASVNDGDLDTSLLGLAYLNRFSRIVIDDDRMILER
ncbi:aspartyl protease family protein [Monaibacterium marinum]|uniref:Aspartyl protease family protein n=1 Tax=Pontivivens marinum TaxID=1690039 RepID=A0A2C9CR20_9RHOB|nr:TIGR02281 family clan AA aspartic protease [Monaibacterium marinum]SOH93667.1 aspartyl protease family protein [Monaibacterium marinum]